MKTKRFVGEPVELSRDCELGQEGDRAVVTMLDDHYMTLHFPDRAPDCRDVHTGADYKYLRAYGAPVDVNDPITVLSMDARARLNKWGKYAAKNMSQAAARRELRDLVATYLEGSDDAPRAAELLDALDPLPSMLSDTFWEKAKEALANAATNVQKDETASARWKREERERSMFGCTAAAIDEVLATKEPRDIAMYAMGSLSNAQELISRDGDEPFAWSVRRADANTIRQLMNIAKYAIDKAVPR